jgi:hypothetical protein
MRIGDEMAKLADGYSFENLISLGAKPRQHECVRDVIGVI